MGNTPATTKLGDSVFSEILHGAKLWRLSIAIAITELDQRYRRTIFGKGWIALTFVLFVSVKVFIFGALNGVPMEFFAPYLALGFMLFRFITQSVTGGASVFTSSQNWIKTEPLPLTLHLLAFMMKNFVLLAFMSIPTMMICIWAGRYSWVALASLPFFLLLYAINHLWISTLLGIIASRYRDLVHFLTTIMQVLYFATPILWVPTGDGVRAIAAKYNPLTHYIAIFRDPFMYGTVPWMSWAVVIPITILGCFLSLWVFKTQRKNIVYWV